MRFWDSSALVPLCVDEPATDLVMGLARQDSELVVWWTALVECDSALARLEREGLLAAAAAAKAFRRLDLLSQSWTEIEPQHEIREVARRLLRVHALRAADALHIAAAYLAAERRPPTLEVVTLDERLREAAAKEGFVLTIPENP